MSLAVRADSDSLEVYACAVANYAAAAEFVARVGTMVVSADGQAVKNPACSVVNTTALVISRFATEFGFTPAARANLGLPLANAEVDDLAAARPLT